MKAFRAQNFRGTHISPIMRSEDLCFPLPLQVMLFLSNPPANFFQDTQEFLQMKATLSQIHFSFNPKS